MKQLVVSLVLLAGVIALAVTGVIYRRRAVPVVNPPYVPPTVLTEQQRAAANYELNYKPAGNVGDVPLFAKSLAGAAVYTGGDYDVLYVAGDREVKSFDHCGQPGQAAASFPVAAAPLCVGVDGAGNVLVGQAGQMQKYSPAGALLATIGKGELGRVTAVAAVGDEVLAADADARQIVRFDAAGKVVGRLGPPAAAATQPEDLLFRVRPGGRLAMAAGPAGRLIAANPVAHQVIVFNLGPGPLHGQSFVWGRFSQDDPAGFAASGNPQDLAVLMRNGLPCVVTAEQGIARVKVYDLSGTLLGVIGPDAALLDGANGHMSVASDRGGRLYVCDTARRGVRLFVAAR